ncbi:AAEL013603-PA [Aedes aegypti]|uniref:AAEL013603-PA n=1 Tax=Aedes aegypti TaxID=7159 RepID=Q16IN3_AEDAE|nr:AAEL013603-PA [Aedes aegypti]
MAHQEQYFQHKDGEYTPASVDFTKIKNARKSKQFFVQVIKVVVMFIPTLVTEWYKYLFGKKKSVKGQVALVTGGGNGLGRALCFRLAKEGCLVAVADIDMISAERTAAEIRSLGHKSAAFKVDVGDQRSIEQLKIDVEAQLGPVDILVNNAGLLAMLSLSEGNTEDVQRIVNVNFTSHIWAIRAFKDGMMERRRGHIVAVSSTFGIVPFGRTVCYSATKFGVRGLMEGLNEEFYMNGYTNDIFVTCVYPGFVATRKEFMEYLEQLGCRVPINTPDEVADTAIDAVLRNRCEVITSSLIMRIMLKFYAFMPNEVSRLLLGMFIDKVPQLTVRKED